LTSCSDSTTLKFHHDFGEEMIWSESLKWDWDVHKNDLPYTIKAYIQVSTHIPLDQLDLEWVETDPTGNQTVWQNELIIRNADQSFQGDPSGDYVDLELEVYSNKTFHQHGVHHYELKHRTENSAVPYVLDIKIEAVEIKNH
jgi:hypothetical protein